MIKCHNSTTKNYKFFFPNINITFFTKNKNIKCKFNFFSFHALEGKTKLNKTNLNKGLRKTEIIGSNIYVQK